MAKKGLFQKLRDLFFGGGNDETFEAIEDLLIEADLGYKTASALTNDLRQIAKTGKLQTKDELYGALKDLLRPLIRVKPLDYRSDELNLYLFLGVNGVGKTTSIAKLAYWLGQQARGPVVLAAGDTFRAAAAEQLQLHGQRQSLRVVAQKHGADPGAVLYDALESARAQKDRVVLADTAGRLHNKTHLVKELQKIDKIAKEKVAGGVYQKILVLDATTGQNAFQQAQVFHEAVGIDAVVLSKYDSSGKGGIVVAVSRELGLPFAFFGTGERPQDFQAFDVETFLDGLLGEE
ncbi:MAG TPA: signal recognition particle-docking protein FtsY [Spirochaetia bacterium]|nr:signal recognition particle-docking protein FtsY [Spirochaetia bacterium]